MANQLNLSFSLSKIDTKENFHRFLIQKIRNKIKEIPQESIMTAIAISKPLPGFTISNNIGFDIISKMCALCDHVAISPFRCESCFDLYCERCSYLMLLVNKMKNNERTVGTTLNNINKIFCISSTCLKVTIIERLIQEQEYEQELLTVNCIYENCSERNFYKLMIKHINECKFNSSKFKFDPAFIADTFINIVDPKLVQDNTMLNYLSTIGNTEKSEENRNIIAQDVYGLSFHGSFQRQTAHLLNLKTKIVDLATEIESVKSSQPSTTEPKQSTANQKFNSITNDQRKFTVTSEPVFDSQPKDNVNEKDNQIEWGNWFTSEEEKERYTKEREARQAERQKQREIEFNLNQEIRARSKDSLAFRQLVKGYPKPNLSSAPCSKPRESQYESQKSLQIATESEPAFKKVKSVIVTPDFKPAMPPEIDEQLFSIPSTSYRPDSKPGPTLKQSSDYANLMKRRWHEYQRRHSVERNLKTAQRRERFHEAVKAEFCSIQLNEKIKPPQHFAWLIAKNNIKLHEDNLNACAIDIENLQLRVKTSDDNTEIIQVPCWISIVDSSGEIVLNEFVRHAKTAIHDYLTEHHGLTWNHLKNAPHFLIVRQKVITILRKYKRIIVSGQAQDFKNLLITKEDHSYLLPRIICVSSYYNCRRNSPQFGLKYCIFTLFGKLTQKREHSSLIDAANTMYLYLIDYERIEKTHNELLKTLPIRVYGPYYGYIYPKNHLMSGLLSDIMKYIGDWPLNLIKNVAMYKYMSKEKRETKIANSSYNEENYVYSIPEPRPIPYKFSETKFVFFRPRTY